MALVVAPEDRETYVDLICQAMADGLTRTKACELYGLSAAMVWFWFEQYPELRAKYDKAREALMAHWEDQIMDITDTPLEGTIERDTPQGLTIERRDMIEHRKLQVHTRQWMLSKLKPRQFGDKMALGGAADLPPIQSKADVTLSPEDAYKQMLGIGNGRT